MADRLQVLGDAGVGPSFGGPDERLAMHLLGTDLTTLAVLELGQPEEQRLNSLLSACGLALGVHTARNGAIAVAIALFAEIDRVGFAR